MKVLHIITGLNTGGAETMLFKLLSALRTRDEVETEVVSLRPPGRVASLIAGLGIPVSSPEMDEGVGALARWPRLVSLVRASRPDLVQTWMSHANVLGGLAARAAGPAPVLWGLRQSQLAPGASKRSTEAVIRVGAWLSRWVPARIVCVSEAARRAHVALGYDAARCLVVPNGFDLTQFRPDPEARTAMRAELGVGSRTPLVGLIARVDPYKDHATFFAAAALVRRARPETVFVLAGEGAEADNAALAPLIRDSGLTDAVRLLGPRSDVARLTAALDVAVSSSASGEAFSNTLGEALCAGVPVVTTDVGDSAMIAGAEGRVVPPRAPAALAKAIETQLALSACEREALGVRARARMEREFGIAAIAERYLALYGEVLGRGPR